MRKIKFMTGLILSVVVLGVISCENTNESPIKVEGTYIGSFSRLTSLNGTIVEGSDINDGTAVVTLSGNDGVLVHCYGGEIDTTFLLDMYPYEGDFLLCQTGDQFQQEYGHQKGERHMGHMGSSQTEWMHHLEDDHAEADEHYGEFNMRDGAFNFTFRMMEGNAPYYLKFHGINN